MSIEELRVTSRIALHRALGRDAVYYPSPRSSEPPEFIIVRYHSGVAQVGDLQGTNLSYAEVHDRIESVVFLHAEVPDPKKNSLVVVAEDEGYVVKSVRPRDGITVTAEVVRAHQDALTGKLLPDGRTIP